MTIANVSLTENQRQQLLAILNRRFRKMTDLALLELERLTRHPVNLAGFQVRTSDLVDVKPAVLEKRSAVSDEVIDAEFSKSINRREFLAYSVSGLLGLLFFGTGYGWIKSDESVGNLSATLADVGGDINSLTGAIQQLQESIRACSEEISNFQNTYQPTIYSIAQLKNDMDKTQGLYDQLGQAGITITELIQFILNSWIPIPEKYIQPINAVLELVTKTPETLSLTDQVLAYLDIWFSNDPEQGITNKVLSPAHSIFQIINNDVKLKVESMQATLASE